MTTPTVSAEPPQALRQITRYKIGYATDDWGMRSSSPSGIPDASGSWVRYADHVAQVSALTSAQAGVPAGWLPVHSNGRGFYGGPLKTEDEAKRYIDQVHQSNDSVTLVARPFVWSDAAVPQSLPWPWTNAAEVLNDAISHIDGQERLKDALRLLAAAGVTAGAVPENTEANRRAIAENPGEAISIMQYLRRRIDELKALVRAPQPPAAAQEPVATVIKKGAERQWMSERLGGLPDGIYSLFLGPQRAAPAETVSINGMTESEAAATASCAGLIGKPAEGDALEKIAAQWDGCMYDAVGGEIDIGQSIRAAALAAQKGGA